LRPVYPKKKKVKNIVGIAKKLNQILAIVKRSSLDAIHFLTSLKSDQLTAEVKRVNES
jgi:hypothetical protein